MPEFLFLQFGKFELVRTVFIYKNVTYVELIVNFITAQKNTL